MSEEPDQAARLCECIAEHARGHGWTVAVAESLTGGELSGRLSAAPQASQWYAGAVVAYSSQVKFTVLGVPAGPVVTEACARQMAESTRAMLQADVAISTTGVGGPDAVEGQPPGTVWIGVSGLGPSTAVLQRVAGDPSAVVAGATRHSLRVLLDRLEQATSEADRQTP